jgi:hypothetical protein
MQLFNKVKDLRLGKAKTSVERASSIQNAPSSLENAPPSIQNECQTEPVPSAKGESSPGDSTSITSGRWNEFCEKYDQWPKNQAGISRTMHLDQISCHAAKLHKHHWTLLTQSEKYKSREYLVDTSICGS